MQTINTYYQDYDHLKIFLSEHYDILFAKTNRSVLVQVFCGICDKGFLETLLSQVTELIPHAQIIGTTTGGEIMNGAVSSLKTVLSFSIFQYTDIKIAYALQNGSSRCCSSFQLGQTIAADLLCEQTKILVLFSSGKIVNSDLMLKGIFSVDPSIPIAGGISGDNFFNKQSFVFCNKKIIDCGVVGISLNSNCLSVFQHWHLCWQPIGKEMTITEANGSRIYTIDNIPAREIYSKYLGVDGKTSIVNSIFPLITQSEGIEIVKTPSIIYEDGSIEFLTESAVGEKVRFSLWSCGYDHRNHR